MADQIERGRIFAATRTKERVAQPKFIRGPIPLAWMTKAAQLPGNAAMLGLAAWWRCGLTGNNTVAITSAHAMRFGVKSRSGRRDALNRLAEANLITVEYSTNASPQVTILGVDAHRKE